MKTKPCSVIILCLLNLTVCWICSQLKHGGYDCRYPEISAVTRDQLLENTNLHLHIPFCQNSDINLYILETKCISANQTSSRTQAVLILFPWDLLNRKMDLTVEYFPQSIFRLHNYIFHKFQKIFQKKQKHPSAHFWQIWLSSDCATELKSWIAFTYINSILNPF